MVIGKGEASAIVLAKKHRGVLASNNLRDVLDYVHEFSLSHVTTGDILLDALHKGLTDDSARIRDWERRMWRRVIRGDKGALRMHPTDQYVFHIVHMHKDFLNGSLGLRRIVDTWLLESKTSPETLDGACAELAEMGLDEFGRRMSRLGRACMGLEPVDENADVLLSHAFRHGIYGTSVSYKAGCIVTMTKGGLMSGKARSALASVLLPYARMKAQFPVLEQWPVLLPLCWGRRAWRLLRRGDPRRYVRMLDYSGVTEAEFEEMRRFLEAGGVRHSA